MTLPRPMHRNLLAMALAALGLCSAPVRAADSIATMDPTFVVVKTDAATITGRLVEITADSSIVIAPEEGEPQRLPIVEIVKLHQVSPSPIPQDPEGGVLLFPGGDRLHRTSVIGIKDENLEVQSFAFGSIAIPFDSLLGILLNPPPDREALSTLVGRIRSEPRESEVVWLSNGDRLVGGLLGLTERQVSIKSDANVLDLDRSGVLAVGFDPALVRYPVPESPFWEVVLSDGSRLGVTGARVEKGQLVAATRSGVPIRVGLPDVTLLYARHPGLTYLSDLEPTGKQYLPYVGRVREYQKDLAADGRPLCLQGQVYTRGIGTQSRTLLAYRLGDNDRRFQALIGLDDRAGPLGNVVFRVLVDNKVRFTSRPMSIDDRPLAVDVDLSGGKFLILDTEFGERGDVRDLADWVEARIIR